MVAVTAIISLRVLPVFEFNAQVIVYSDNKALPASHPECIFCVVGSDTAFVEWTGQATSICRGGLKVNLWETTILRIVKSGVGRSIWSSLALPCWVTSA